MQRVSAIRGDFPALIIAPHGHDQDDTNTAVLATQIVRELGCYGVINHCWKRADKYDYDKEHANCNSLHHIEQDVVRQEFFIPIQRFIASIYNEGYIPNVYIIHGFAGTKKYEDPVDVVLGIGNGDPPSWSCDAWIAASFATLMEAQGFYVAFGKAGGNYSGRNPDNLNQLGHSYRGILGTSKFQSIQIEIAKDFRSTVDEARMTGNDIAIAIEDNVERQQNVKKWSTEPYRNSWPMI